jgi:hypothetical protein
MFFVKHYGVCPLLGEFHGLLDEFEFEPCRPIDFCNDSRGRLLQADAVYRNRER